MKVKEKQQIRTYEREPIEEWEYEKLKNPFGYFKYIFVEAEQWFAVSSFNEALGNGNPSATCRNVREHCLKMDVATVEGARPNLFITLEGMIQKIKNIRGWKIDTKRASTLLEFLEGMHESKNKLS